MTVLAASPLPARGPLTLVEPAAGVYEPLFTTATGLASASGLAVASGGGLIAAVAGTLGSGVLTLPGVIDSTKPWRFGVLFEYNGDTTNRIQAFLNAPSSVPNSAFYQLGLNDTTGANQTAETTVAGGPAVYYGLSMTAGQRYWFIACSDGTTVVTALLPEHHAGLSNNPASVGLGVANEAYKSYPVTFTSGGFSVFTQLSQIYLATRSRTTKILGVFCQPQSLLGAPDVRCQPPGLVFPTINGDSDTTIRIPKSYTGRQPTDIILVGHPNASDIGRGINSSDFDGGAAFASLVNAGYIMGSILGDPSTGYTSATASDWGAPAGLVYRKKLLEWIRANLPNTRDVYWIGQSMGCLDGLMFHATYPGILRGLIGISGVTNLSDSYTLRGFGATINTAYGVSALASVTDHDPALRPALYTTLPMLLYHGASDTLIPGAQNGAAFATAVNAAGGNASYVSVPSAGHLDTAALWDGPGLLRFLQALSAR